VKLLAALLLLTIPAFAGKKTTKNCSSYFAMVEQDDFTEKLAMAGFTNGQNKWYEKHSDDKEYGGVCVLLPNTTGQRVPAASLKDANMPEPEPGKPVFVVAWHLTQGFVPDNNGGHYAYYASGVLSRLGTDPQGNLIPIGPVHDTSRTIFSDPAISLLKAVIKQIKEQGSGLIN
jgi:hypothetical protein